VRGAKRAGASPRPGDEPSTLEVVERLAQQQQQVQRVLEAVRALD